MGILSTTRDVRNSISHLCFADDLLVLCHGDLKSIQVIKRAMETFSSMSVGSLLVSYLGVTLITKQLSFIDCKCLIDRVKAKVNNWMNKMLSYAGRLQLVSSILSSMQVYWASVFILPKSVIKDIDKLLKGFLWCQGEISRGKAKIAWKQVCKTKEEGGLCIKNLCLWNEVLMSKHLWNVVTMKDSVWVRWINDVRLKGNSIWKIGCDKNTSSGWKSILGLRDKMRKHIICKVGDGSSIFLWHDKRWGPEPISTLIPMETVLKAGLESKVGLKDTIRGDKWSWPVTLQNLSVLKSIHVPKLSDGIKDKFLWYTNDGKTVNYSTKKAWKDWRNTSDKVRWHDFVWFSNCTPKHSFIMWIAVQGRLTTQERLIKWYLDKQVACLFREDIVNFMIVKKHNKSIKSLLLRLILAACVYYIWTERNKRHFTNEKQNCKEVVANVEDRMCLHEGECFIPSEAYTSLVSWSNSKVVAAIGS
ncbi:RNA-directed DNA polymerase, eukaryota, reverse transcriptase zinc-binding domain protein [Tanacetum coccineum]